MMSEAGTLLCTMSASHFIILNVGWDRKTEARRYDPGDLMSMDTSLPTQMYWIPPHNVCGKITMANFQFSLLEIDAPTLVNSHTHIRANNLPPPLCSVRKCIA